MSEGVWLLLAMVYLLPAIVAAIRKHPQEWPIGLLTLLLGWTILGWIAALIWASSNFERKGVT